jgi:CRISPR-associated endonuclease Csn1
MGAMGYRLALDLGTTSLGWAVIKLKEGLPMAVVKAGVRIFSDGRNPKDGASLAVGRREARAMRRRRDRLLKRKNRLTDALVRLGFFPEDMEARRALTVLNPYELRANGVDQALSGEEFARALFHLNQRRGFLSNRKTDKADNESGALKGAIKELRQKLVQENCRTLGQWLAKRHAQGDSVRARLRGKLAKEKAYDYYADRAMIENEFDVLWAMQASVNPTLFNEAARLELKDILLHQRPLKPVRPGRCTLLPELERAPLALPSVQRFRVFQELNNLRLLTAELTGNALSLAQRNILVDLLERKNEVKFSAMVTALGLPGTTQFNLEDIKRDRLKGNLTSAILSKDLYFGARWFDFSLQLQDQIVLMLLNEASESVLVSWLQKETGVNEEVAERIANVSLPEGYGNLSKEALDRILPSLAEQVITYDKAVIAAGFDSHSALSHALQTGEIMPSLPYYGIPLQRHVAFEKPNPRNDEEKYGKIANPTVHIGLNQVRVVVNELIAKYGLPDQVVIEVARDLKISREKKQELLREQKKNQDQNDLYVKEACRVLGLEPLHIDKHKRRELSQKMQLWVELNPRNVADRQCPYTGEQISIEKLLSSEVEIEHILPFSVTLDDTMANKTVCVRRANRAKGNRSPYEAFGAIPQPEYDYAAILQRAALMKNNKKKRFAPDAYEQCKGEHSDFLARALNDTAYLSRIAKEYLTCICPDKSVWAIPGGMTAKLRGKFGLNKLLSETGEKNRDDHRHHALDAMVIGITDRAMLQKFAKASALARQAGLDRLVETIELPWPTYREHVQRALQHITVSHKPDHGYQGAMHEETAWGLRENGQVTRRVIPEGGQFRERVIENKRVIPMAHANLAHRHGLLENGEPKPYKGYLGGSNYCMEIWKDEKGKWQSEIVSTYDAYQIIRKYGEVEGQKKLRDPKFTQSGKPLIMRLARKDYIKINTDGVDKLLIVVSMRADGRVALVEHQEANVDARNRDKNDSFTYLSKMAGPLQGLKARRCTVSPAGIVRDPGFSG